MFGKTLFSNTLRKSYSLELQLSTSSSVTVRVMSPDGTVIFQTQYELWGYGFG